ncbi:PIN domain-containing protein [Flavobacteriaceae bacterium 14752]|nr:PIN domain-containing protein [Flavobacteriaceae bacterium 14752]
MLTDFNNHLLTSSIVVSEILQLQRIGKIKSKKYKSALSLHEPIKNEFYIKLLTYTKYHTKTLSKLTIPKNHNDPFDHAIIAHAITEKLTLVSSDRKFQNYTAQGLDFVYNKR